MTARERLFALEQFGIKLGLDNITTLIEALQRPDRTFRAVHVGGTNGKGSVTAMVERGLRAAGHHTGRYTSPHLADIEERIAVDGTPVSAAEFDEVAGSVLALIDRLLARGDLTATPTFFEATTAVAFDIFRRREVDVAVIEVGLGGRFDATNVITPVVTAITSIALDHQAHLGNSIAEIAFEKAGIIKPGVPVVLGRVVPDARRVLHATAERVGAPIIDAVVAREGTPVVLALNGEHQHENAAIAVATLRQCAAAGLDVARAHIVTALTEVEWPARLEWLHDDEGFDVLLDAAHNPAGAAALAGYMRDTTGPLPLVIGVAADKNIDGIVQALADVTARWVTSQARSARAMPAEALASRIAQRHPGVRVDAVADPEGALTLALTGGERAVVAGSILLVGPLRARLIARGARPVRYPSTVGPFLLE